MPDSNKWYSIVILHHLLTYLTVRNHSKHSNREEEERKNVDDDRMERELKE